MSTYENSTGNLTPQSLLRQRYIILRQAGQGGMGAVYEAIDTSTPNRSVAIKEMSQAHLNPEQLFAATAQFQREAILLHGLSHINLPRVYDAFTEHERSYLVM
ncbi:MAG: protein kinase, partial [Chloroflexota bacterium]|nr:protein kinase [Chloroflexota bacterium]